MVLTHQYKNNYEEDFSDKLLINFINKKKNERSKEIGRTNTGQERES